MARLFTNGWDTGTIRRIRSNSKKMPAADGIVYEVQFDGDRGQGPRNTQLNRELYVPHRDDATLGGWHFLEPVVENSNADDDGSTEHSS